MSSRSLCDSKDELSDVEDSEWGTVESAADCAQSLLFPSKDPSGFDILAKKDQLIAGVICAALAVSAIFTIYCFTKPVEFFQI